MMKSVPASSKTVSDWYKQDVYDPSNHSIDKIDDVLVSEGGQISALVIGVGGFLGVGEKDVAVPFTAVKRTSKDKKLSYPQRNKGRIKVCAGSQVR